MQILSLKQKHTYSASSQLSAENFPLTTAAAAGSSQSHLPK
jgi:hypothetical protein